MSNRSSQSLHMTADTSLSTWPTDQYKRARLVVWMHFFMGGFLFAAWGVEIPNVKLHYGISEADLGVMLLASGVGSLCALAMAGRVIARFGASLTLLCTQAMAGTVMSFLFVSPNTVGLLAVLFMFGFAGSLADVAINAEAAELEIRSKKVLMSSCHGMFSLGGMVGAAVAAILFKFNVSAQMHLISMTIVVLTTVVSSHLMKPRDFGLMEPKIQTAVEKRHMRFPLPVILLGSLACLGFLAEGAMYDWSVLYMKQELVASEQMASLAYAFFCAAMAMTRFIGDWVRSHFHPANVLCFCAFLVAGAMVLMLQLANPYVALVCFALVGGGLANMVPILFSAAIKIPGVTAAQSIAAVSSVGYLGLMGGPAIIGFVAHASTLTLALYIVVACALAQAVFAKKALGYSKSK